MKRALSLIEILVAVSIIGIIATIAIPNLESARIQADAATLMSHIDAQELAWTLYVAEEDLDLNTVTGKNGGNAAPPKVLALLGPATTVVQFRMPTITQNPDGSWVPSFEMKSQKKLLGPAGITVNSSLIKHANTNWLRKSGATTGLGPLVLLEGRGPLATARLRALYHLVEQRGWLMRYTESRSVTFLAIAIWAHGRPPLKGSPSSAGNGSGS